MRSAGQQIRGDVVASWDEDIGNLDGFLEGGLGGFAVGAFEDLSGLDVFDGGEGVAADEGGGGGLGDEEAAGSLGNSWEGEEIDGFDDGVLGGLDALEELDVSGEHVHQELFVFGEFFSAIVGFLLGVGELGEGLGDGDSDGFAFGWGDEPLGFVEEFDGAPGFGVEAGEEDMGDLVGSESGAFGEAGGDGLGGESGVDDYYRVIGLDERGGGMSGADGGSLVPEGMSGEGAD